MNTQAIIKILDDIAKESIESFGKSIEPDMYPTWIKKAKDRISSLPSLDNQWETLEDIIEDIGKWMCHLDLLYPNAGYWNLQSWDQFDYKWEDLKKAFNAFRWFLKAQKLII